MSAPDARRLEELSLNSSAPPGQLVHDGWLLRLAAGKAKRARSVNAVYASRLPLAGKVAYCERLYEARGLPILFRVTPFSEPAGLDAALAQRGYVRFDDTAVESAPIGASAQAPPGVEALELPAWVEAIGELRGSPAAHRAAHLARLQGMPLAMRALVLRDAGRIVATGLAMAEDDCAGLFDVVTDERRRREGHARTVVRGLLAAAREMGARHAYLQVTIDNEPARRLYREFGFEERYLYWYRARPGQAR